METQPANITIERYNIAALVCWASFIIGLSGLGLYIAMPAGFVWFSILGIVLGGFGLLVSSPLKTTETKTVFLEVPETSEFK